MLCAMAICSASSTPQRHVPQFFQQIASSKRVLVGEFLKVKMAGADIVNKRPGIPPVRRSDPASPSPARQQAP